MKQLMLVVMIALSYCATAQEILAPVKGSYEFYSQKSRKQKTGAWVLLAGGTVLSVVGITTSLANMTLFSQPTPEEKRRGRFGNTLFVIGATTTLGSLPLFFASTKNKKKARLLVKNESAYLPYQLPRKGFATVSLSISL